MLNYGKYPLGAIIIGEKAVLFFKELKILISIASLGQTPEELIGGSLLKDSLVKSTLYSYKLKIAYLKELIEKIYVSKAEAVMDGVLDQRKIKLWNSLFVEFGDTLIKTKQTQDPELPNSLKPLQEE